MLIRERDRANADNVLLVHRIISEGRGKKERGERKEFDKIFESESFDSADLRDTGSRLLSLFERLVAVVT